MNCTNCKHEWCWICGGNYEGKFLWLNKHELHEFCGIFDGLSGPYIILIMFGMILAPFAAFVIFCLCFVCVTIGVNISVLCFTLVTYFKCFQYFVSPVKAALFGILCSPILLALTCLSLSIASAGCAIIGALVLTAGLIFFTGLYLFIIIKASSISV